MDNNQRNMYLASMAGSSLGQLGQGIAGGQGLSGNAYSNFAQMLPMLMQMQQNKQQNKYIPVNTGEPYGPGGQGPIGVDPLSGLMRGRV